MQCDVVFGGAGTLIPALAGAWREIEKTVSPVRVAGTSAGSMVAAAIAFDIQTSDMIEVGKRLLLRGALLDRRVLGMARPGWGLYSSDRIRDEVRNIIPHKMGDARIPFGAWVTRIEAESAVFIDADRFSDLYVADVVAASCSIPGFFAARRIRGLPGWFADGGVAANFGTDVFDYSPDPTIGVRVVKGEESFPLTTGRRECDDPMEYFRAVMATMMASGSRTHESKKTAYGVVDVQADGSVVDFNMTLLEIDEMIARGESSAALSLWRLRQKEWWKA